MGRSCILVLILLLLSLFCKSDDQLTQTKPLSPGNKLISKSGDFALGFFSKTNSNQSLYLGIWYNNIPERTVVWVANRDSPISAASSTILTITNTSDLVLIDSNGLTSWLSKNKITSGATGVAAVLLNTGNFVLRLPNGTDIWQSFDHPTDTMLPSMRVLVSYRAHVAARLVAWKGPDDPSSGEFSISGDLRFPDLQSVIWNMNRPYCRISVLGGVSASGGTDPRNSSSVWSQEAIYLGDEFYYMFTVSEGSPFTRITLDYTGKLKSLSWNNRSSSWTLISARPAAACDLYAACGPFSYCDFTQIVPTCQCLDGFEPDGLNFSRGCRRTTMLECDKQNHFLTLPGMKVPDKFLHIQNRSFDQCVAECSRNCSCTAYAYANLSSAGAIADPSRCLVWLGELIDVGKTPFGENLYLRLANSSGHSSAVNNKSGVRVVLKIVLPVVSFLLILTCVYLALVCKLRGIRVNKKREVLGHLSISQEVWDQNLELQSIRFEDISTATNNFHDTNVLGKGGFGKVYKGTLEDGKEVAVKRLSKGSEQGIEHFRNEVVLIAKLQHKNLVRLLGCCIHEDEKLLIYECLPNKSLDKFLFFDIARKSMLDWPRRLNIIKGVARGLLYLHQDSRTTIIHRDLKPSNILLDAEMNPKISDFGMARIFGGNEQQESTKRVVGTYGYMSPEYAMEGIFWVKSDTYSFGILLLEIVSGLKISSPLHLVMDFPNLIACAWNLWADGKATDFMDTTIRESYSPDEVSKCIHIGLLCVQDSPNARPHMSSVVFMLDSEAMPRAVPKQPMYFAQINHETEEARDDLENSVNGASLTVLEGR